MRLLNAKTLQLEEFLESEVPEYAILSHTWGRDEVTFQDFLKPSAKSKQGFRKIEYCCKEAVEDDLSYAWVDTCCIDKSSSAELSETINSMYRWYQKARLCYVYLEDVECTPEDSCFEESFVSARWFTRGWTLQELIAPRIVQFFICKWKYVGSKGTLSDIISKATGIDKATLSYPILSSVSIARRMFWASKRMTTRVEDLAYCLLGIFDVNMPLLYGEGEKAFMRLQEEIMKESEDQSLFAWEPMEAGVFSTSFTTRGILAAEPLEFRNGAQIVSFSSREEPYTMTNRGLRINLPILKTTDGLIAVLGCFKGDYSGQLGIVISSSKAGFGRVPGRQLVTVSGEEVKKAKVKTIYLVKKPQEYSTLFPPPPQKCWVRGFPSDHGYSLSGVTGINIGHPVDMERRIIYLPVGTIALHFSHLNAPGLVVIVRQNYSWQLGVAIPILKPENVTFEEFFSQINFEALSYQQRWTLELNSDSCVHVEMNLETIFDEGIFVLDVGIEKHPPPKQILPGTHSEESWN